MTDTSKFGAEEAMNFLGTMTDRLGNKDTPGEVSNDKLLQLINVIDERTMNLVGSMGNDLARILINITALVEILISKDMITEDEFNLQVHKTALDFRTNMEKAEADQTESNDGLDDIQI